MTLIPFVGGSSYFGIKTVESESALKIQKVFLGFLVRKSFRNIIDLDRRVTEIHNRICQEDSFDFIMKNVMERIKVNEALMSLILRLDSLAVYSSVRCCRKAVIKKAIALQETVDVIGSIDSLTVDENQSREDFMIVDNRDEAPVDDSLSSSKSNATSDSFASLGEFELVVKRDVKSYQSIHKNLNDQELMEKMMEDNVKLMNMMHEVFEMNHLQAQSISALTARVDQLERARLEDNLRKIRKRIDEVEMVFSKQ